MKEEEAEVEDINVNAQGGKIPSTKNNEKIVQIFILRTPKKKKDLEICK